MTTKEQYRLNQRNARIAANGGFEDNINYYIGQVFSGKLKLKDNSHLWNLRDEIHAEVAMKIRQNQLDYEIDNPQYNENN